MLRVAPQAGDNMYYKARIAANLSREAAAERIPCSTRALAHYELGDLIPPCNIAYLMSKVYQQNWLWPVHQRQNCLACREMGYEVLDNINQDIPTIMLKLLEELQETTGVIQRLMRLVINKRSRQDFTPDEWTSFVDGVLELLDVEHGVKILKMALQDYCGQTELVRIVEMHNQKCREKRYVLGQKEKAARVGARTAAR